MSQKRTYLRKECKHRFAPFGNKTQVCALLQCLCRDGYGKDGCTYAYTCPFCGMVLPEVAL